MAAHDHGNCERCDERDAELKRLKSENYWSLIEYFQDLIPPGGQICRDELLQTLESQAVHKPQATLRQQLNQYKLFSGLVFDYFGKGSWELDCFDFEEIGVKTGLVERVVYDPDTHGEIEAAEPGDRVWVPTELGRAALREAIQASLKK